LCATAGERRPHDLSRETTDLPRTATGAPAAQYVPAEARSTPRVYAEAKVADCLSTTGGLAGTRASPLAQHYYCSLPGLSPDIRGCFTFQLRLPRVSRTRSAWDDGYLVDGTKLPIQKGWKFLGPDPAKVPDVATAFNYCVVDGRPHVLHTQEPESRASGRQEGLSDPHAFHVLGGADAAASLSGHHEWHDQSAALGPDRAAAGVLRVRCIKGKVSASRFKILCGFSADTR
jgi:hypothetical protein